MQKNKIATIIIIMIILAYGLLGTCELVIDFNIPYVYIINPLFWIVMAIFSKYFLAKTYEKKKMKKDIISYVLIASFSFIIIYIISGLFVTFGDNPFVTNFKGYLINLWVFMSVFATREYVRYKLINNVYDKDKKLIAIIIACVYIVIDLELNKFIIADKITLLMIIRLLAQVLFTAVAKNILFSYLATITDYIPAIIYEFITNSYMWLAPILPNSPWIVSTIIESMIPIILFLYIRYLGLRNELFRSREKLIKSDPRNIITLVAVVVLAIWFAVGIFPIYPIAVASASMVPEFYVGDIAIIQKCSVNDVAVGDVIQYQLEGFTVIHRVAEKRQNNGEVTFITKGDNNKYPDADPVKENQLLGKAIFKIKYLGFPAIWLHLVEQQEAMDVQVETGR